MGMQMYNIANVADLFRCQLLDGSRDSFYYVSILKRVVKTAYKIPRDDRAEFIREPKSTGSPKWDATLASLTDYIAHNIFKTSAPIWTKKYVVSNKFEPLKDFFPDGYQTSPLSAFLEHNVILPEGSLKCLIN